MSGGKDRSRTGYVGDCPDCGKRRYLSRSNAKRAARINHPGDSRMAEYLCGGFWHLGHLPSHVVNRGLTRAPYKPGGDAA